MDGTPRESPPTSTEAQRAPARRFRWARYAVLSVAGALLVATALTALFWAEIARALVERAAARRGVDLTAKHVTLSLSAAHLEGVDATLRSAPGLRVRAESVDVELATLVPTRAHLHGVELDADDPRALLGALATSRESGGAGLAADAERLTLRVRRIAASVPVAIELTADTASHDGGHTDVEGLRGTAPITGAPFGPFAASLRRDAAGTTLTTTALPKAKVTIAPDGKSATLALAPVALPGLARAGSQEPVRLSGELTVDLPSGDGAPITGDLSALLDGVEIPHPKELDGVGLGSQAKLTARVDALSDRVTFDKIKLADGALALSGGATLTFGGLEGDLEGSIACSQLAGSVVAARLGLDGNPLATALAGGAVSGDVGVHLHVSLDTRTFKARVTPSAVVHCSLGL